MRKIPKGGDVTSAFGLTNCLYVDLISVEAERDVVNWRLSDDSPIRLNECETYWIKLATHHCPALETKIRQRTHDLCLLNPPMVTFTVFEGHRDSIRPIWNSVN